MGPPEVEVSSYDLLPDGVLVADARGLVVGLNPAGARILRLDVHASIGRPFTEVLPLSDPAGRDWWRCVAPYGGLATRTGHPERYLLLADGRDLFVTARFVRAEACGPLVRLIVCFRDGAARERGQQEQADLVSTVAHELRSPLTSVRGFTATLLSRWDRFTDSQKRHLLETVSADADRVTRLVTELLDVSRIYAGRLEVHREVVDIPGAVARSVRALITLGQDPERFEVDVKTELPDMWLDPDKVDQILTNLLDNAVRHGAGTVRVTVEPARGGVAVSVQDSGEGIAPGMEDQVFRKFWRNTKRGGTGLGLYIVKGLVDAHDGTITVGRSPLGGAEFRFWLPAGTPSFAQ